MPSIESPHTYPAKPATKIKQGYCRSVCALNEWDQFQQQLQGHKIHSVRHYAQFRPFTKIIYEVKNYKQARNGNFSSVSINKFWKMTAVDQRKWSVWSLAHCLPYSFWTRYGKIHYPWTNIAASLMVKCSKRESWHDVCHDDKYCK